MKLLRTQPTLLAVVAEGFFSRLSFGLISFALPLYAYKQGVGLGLIGLLLSLNMIVAVVLKPLAGAAADRFGLKPSLVTAIALRSVVSALLVFATVPWHFFATRSVHGVSIALRDPAINVIIAEQGGKKAIASSFAWYQTAKSFAGSVGKIVAGVLITATSYDVVFGVAFALSLVPVVLVVCLVREGPRGTSAAAAPAGAGHAAPARVADEEPAPPASARPPLLRFAGLGFFISGTAYMLASLFPILAVEYAGLNEASASLIYTLSAIAVLSGPVFGWLSDNVSRKLVLSLRSGANVLSSVVFLALPNFAGMAGGRVLDDLGKAAFRPAWGALMAEVSAFDKKRRARTMGYLSSGEDVGEIAGPIFATLIWSLWGVPVLLGVRIAMAIVTEVYTVLVTRSLKRREPDADAAPSTASQDSLELELGGESDPRPWSAPAPWIGSRVAGYRLEHLLGRGASSAVYLAEHTHLGRKVALKVLDHDAGSPERARERFGRESRLVSALDHPNILPVLDAGEHEGRLYIAMRHVPGRDLESLIASEGPLGLERTLHILEQAANGLDAAHGLGLVHRNVKPASILVEEPSGRVFVGNFGIARQAAAEGLTTPGSFVGSIDYASPEQIQGRPVDARADVYALGCTLYECLTGRAPFEREGEVAVMYAHLTEQPPAPTRSRPDLPAGLDGVVGRALAKAPEDRYGSCAELIAAARAAARERPAPAAGDASRTHRLA